MHDIRNQGLDIVWYNFRNFRSYKNPLKLDNASFCLQFFSKDKIGLILCRTRYYFNENPIGKSAIFYDDFSDLTSNRNTMNATRDELQNG